MESGRDFGPDHADALRGERLFEAGEDFLVVVDADDGAAAPRKLRARPGRAGGGDEVAVAVTDIVEAGALVEIGVDEGVHGGAVAGFHRGAELDREIRDHQHRWLANARDLSSVATAMARERYQLDLCDPQGRDGGNTAVLNRDLEVLVYTWSARLRSFDHQLDELERAYH